MDGAFGMSADRAETYAEASARLGRSTTWLRRRAVRLGLLAVMPVGRPSHGQRVTLTASEWDACAAPRARRLVSVGSLEGPTGRDWRVVLSRCHALGVAVFVNAPGQRAKYSVGAKSAARVVASLRADAAERLVPLRRMAKVCGVHEDALRRIIAAEGVAVQRNARGYAVVDPDAARAAVARATNLETISYASGRTGVKVDALRNALIRAGVIARDPKRRRARLDPKAVDAALAGRAR